MTNEPLTINLSQDWSLYDLNTTQSGLRGDPFAPAPEGAIILPSTNSAAETSQAHLGDEDKKEALYEATSNDKPISHFLGLLNFKEGIQEVVERIELPVVDESDELDEEERIELTLHDEQAAGLDTINLRLKVFNDGSEMAALVEKGIERIEVRAMFLDKDGKTLRRRKLKANIEQNLQNSVEFNIGKAVSTLEPKKGRKSRGVVQTGEKVVKTVKKIIVIIKKVFGKIKKLVAKIKNEPILTIIEALGKLKNKLTGSPYKILNYDFGSKDFRKIEPDQVNPDKKTLILLHGTVKGSFDGRIGKEKKVKGEGSFKFLHNFGMEEGGKTYKNWFDYLDQKSNQAAIKYEQVLSFEHETILDGPKENVEYFINKWKVKLNQPAAIICASRGSLLAKCMSAHPEMNQRIKIDRIAIVSGGFSDYFDKDNGVEAYVQNHRELLPRRAHAFLESLLQIIPQLPGLEVQCKENDSFKAFTEADKVTASSKKVIYYNMTNNYPFHAGKKIEEAAKKFLGDDNDLALSMAAQRDFRPGFNHPDFPPFLGAEKHGNGLKELIPKQQLFKFLTSDLHASLAV